jgi:hypothetical protein
LDIWRAAWPEALAHWSRYTRLRDPLFCVTKVEAAAQGLTGSFAMIRLLDNSVVIDLETIESIGLGEHAVEILAHEIGHHVLAPASATDHFRLLARLRKGLPTLEKHAPLIANLYTDLLINDRLQRRSGLRMDAIYERLHAHGQKKLDTKAKPAGKLWTLYVGIYESLWKLEKGSLGGPLDDAALEGDAWLGARLVRVYADDWMTGAARFAALTLPYLVNDIEDMNLAALLTDIESAAEGCDPTGISSIEDDEIGDSVHPSEDPLITGDGVLEPDEIVEDTSPSTGSGGQMREPFEYGEILRAAGIKLSDEDIAVRYYREQALGHLIPFPTRMHKTSPEPQLEGLDPWSIGDPLDEIDWLETVIQSPTAIPGVTTVRRHIGLEPGTEQIREPVDLDLYVDSSGSMPNPTQQVSFLTLAGAIVALSALKAGANVQATLWSGKHQCLSTNGFVRSDTDILKVLTGFFGGGTAFPIHKLRETYADRPKGARDVHILQISDDGISTMFDTDERGVSGWDVAAHALNTAGGGGTMALNLWFGGGDEWLSRARLEQGWDIHTVTDMSELVEFSRAFSQRTYGETGR